ncbi:hypothetical protein BWQ96_09183 [Gracilariopsis chorda]|uniref:Uncharacterized protein n=1 Tax=Gracilariopsis chorda TaxID=448386 RepID=A0A2V3IGC2_9FLOR|nr:hypothetical protein BWQ96_09181 [Gracilariopsis chorda]PXF41104.1 hypothetical protein BWQ96_09183 [Gracilariopsis chorda]|eukprot:PXF41102.1 hypothetical protein BWQ96_09181 [Gracilariopsis chorda]
MGNNIFSSLTDIFVKLDIPVPPFANGQKKSRALRLANIIWSEPEYEHERSVAQFIIKNRITPDPSRPITLSGSPYGQLPPNSAPSSSQPFVLQQRTKSQSPSNAPAYPTAQVAPGLVSNLEQTLQRLSFDETTTEQRNTLAPPPPIPLSTLPHQSRLDKNTSDYRYNMHPTYAVQQQATHIPQTDRL